MYVITFYSFKGGVGRTMALVNVAAELVRRGRKVLVVDFDLEAPGLETYKRLRPKDPHPGIVEYVTKFRENLEVPDLREYIYETQPIGKRGGRLWVMPAGRRDGAYRNALTDLDWKRLYQDEGGFLLFEDTKKGWEKELQPDYVLIDSRTGDTDVLGICTRQLPDAVVLMFMPNEQNLAGLKNVVRDIRREETEGLKKKIHLHFVAANVPRLDDEELILQKRLREFENEFHFSNLDGLIDRYESLLLLDQTIFVLNRPRSRLAKQYRNLARRLIVWNVEDQDGLDTRRGYDKTNTSVAASQIGSDMILEMNARYLEQTVDLQKTSKNLLCNREWAKLTKLLQGRSKFLTRRYRALALFHQAIALWGLGSEMPTRPCEQIVQITHVHSACEYYCDDCQALSLVYWRLGDRERARRYIHKALTDFAKWEHPVLSYWRCQIASPKEFREDCQLIERMIDGEPLQPLFLTEGSRPDSGGKEMDKSNPS